MEPYYPRGYYATKAEVEASGAKNPLFIGMEKKTIMAGFRQVACRPLSTTTTQ